MAEQVVCDGCGKVAVGLGYLEAGWIRASSYFTTSFFSWKIDACSVDCAKAAIDKATEEIKRRKAIRAE